MLISRKLHNFGKFLQNATPIAPDTAKKVPKVCYFSGILFVLLSKSTFDHNCIREDNNAPDTTPNKFSSVITV